MIFGDGTYGRAMDEKEPITKDGERYKKIKVWVSPALDYYNKTKNVELEKLPDNLKVRDAIIFGNGTCGELMKISNLYFHTERREFARDVKVKLNDALIRFENLERIMEGKTERLYRSTPYGTNYVWRTYPSRYFIRGNKNSFAKAMFIMCSFDNQDTPLLDYYREKLDEIRELEVQDEDFRMAISKFQEENDMLRRRKNEAINELEIISRKVKAEQRDIFEQPQVSSL